VSHERPNIVLVTVDSLRADHCGFMGYEEDTTPNLDSMAEDGLVFENTISPGPATFTSMPAIFTGQPLYLDADGFTERQAQIQSHIEQFQTIPEWFQRHDYTTIGYTPNPFTSRHFGFNRGFDCFEDFLGPDSNDIRSRIVSKWANDEFVAGLRFGINIIGVGDISMTWEDYYEDLLDQIDGISEPFFLWVFLLEPHWPYRPPRRYRETSTVDMYRLNWRRAPASSSSPAESDTDQLLSLYDSTIQHFDEFVDRLCSDLSSFDPRVIFHADHGEEFGEHGNFGHGPHTYEENLHVPLLIWGTDESDRVNNPVSLDRMPGILRSISDEKSLISDPRGTAWAKMSIDGTDAYRAESWKLIQDSGDYEFYHLGIDPTESEPMDISGKGNRVAASIQSRSDVVEKERGLVATAARELVTEGSDDI